MLPARHRLRGLWFAQLPGVAEDIVRHEAQFSDCVFMQRNMEKHGKLDKEHAFRLIEKTWGKDRLNKDCYKKGAKYEGQ